MKKILVILFNIERAREHEWFIEFLNRDIYEVEFVLINKPDSFLNEYLNTHGVKVYNFNYSGKFDLPGLIYQLFKLMRKNDYDIVHAHLFEATLAGMIAAYLARVKHRVVTRHNADFHHVYFPSAVKYDKLVNFLSTRIIAVSNNVMKILISREGVNPSKIVMIHHGIDVNDFNDENIESIRIKNLRNRYDIPVNQPVIGVVSRFIHLKGLQYIIPAFSDILSEFPDAILVLANAQGSYSSEVYELLNKINPDSYRLIDFENDIPAMYKLFSCFVHVPITETAEAFGQIYLESLAAKVPSVFTKSGVAADFAENIINCLVVPFKDSKAIAIALVKILRHQFPVEEMTQNGYNLVKNNFDVKTKYDKIQKLYAELK